MPKPEMFGSCNKFKTLTPWMGFGCVSRTHRCQVGEVESKVVPGGKTKDL